ncbi:MAG: hypothetical protein WBP26_02065 [Candidatus Saccharimonadales bacterium]
MPSLERVEAARKDHSATIRILNNQLNPDLTTGPVAMLDAAHDVLLVPEQSELRLDALALARGVLLTRLEQPYATDPYKGMSKVNRLFAQFFNHYELEEWETRNSWTQAWPIIRRPISPTEL